MNFTADPCDNFFDYACGGWEKKNDIPDTESDWGQFSILNLQNDNFLKKLINDPKTKKKYQDVSSTLTLFFLVWPNARRFYSVMSGDFTL